MKVAIYARYSSENQRDASIGDQFRICREFAQRQGWHIAAEYSDHAVSGATIMRPGFQAMMREARQKKVDIVMAEALDRHVKRHGTKLHSSGMSIIMIVDALARLLSSERAVGFTLGHDELTGLIEAWLDGYYATGDKAGS